MGSVWDKMDKAQAPTIEIITAYVDHPLWDDLCDHVQLQYGAKPTFEYSRCSVPGWNVKYRRSGRALCTLYPMQGWFVALVVIGEREKPEFDLLLPALGAYTQGLFERTKDNNGLCWLMFEVKDEAVLADVKKCMSLRIIKPEK